MFPRAAIVACLVIGLASISAAHHKGGGGAHDNLKVLKSPFRFRLIRFPKPRPAPDVTLPDLNGNPVRMADLRAKVVFLNFWATWCPPCIEEMPSMEKLHRSFQGKPFEVVAVSVDQGSVKSVRAFVEKGKFTFRVLHDAKGQTEIPFGLRGLPMSYVIDHRGQMVAGAIGAQNWASEKALAYFDGLIREAAGR